MEETIYKCDVCGKTEPKEPRYKPWGWFAVWKKTGNEKDFWYHSRDVCPDCADRCGLVPALEMLAKK